MFLNVQWIPSSRDISDVKLADDVGALTGDIPFLIALMAIKETIGKAIGLDDRC